MFVDLLPQFCEVTRLLVGGADLADVLQRLLHPIRHADGGFFRPLGAASREPAAAEQQAKRRRHPPQAGGRQPPVIYKQAYGRDPCGDVRAVQIPQHMRPDVLHAVHVPHKGLGQVGQIPLAEIAQRKLAQALRQTEAGGLDLVVH